MYVQLDDWLAILRDEYFTTYIPRGGAAVKFAITSDTAPPAAVQQGLESLARAHDLHYAFLDAAFVRLHMIETLFHRVAKGIDWDALIYRFMVGLLTDDGFVVPDDPQLCDVPHIAELSGCDEAELRRRVRVLLRDRIYEDYAMTQEFRFAMVRLCQAMIEPSKSEQSEAEAIKSWLRGELRLISTLKRASIFQKIGRNNARDSVLSLAHWLRLVGKAGMLLVLDITRYTMERRSIIQPDSGLYHTTTAMLDAYEVLRQFIDATGEMESCCIAVIAPTAFLTDEKRGLLRYDALRLRVWDEVRDRRRANPLSALVRLQGDPMLAAG